MKEWIREIITAFPAELWGQQVAKHLQSHPEEKWNDLLVDFLLAIDNRRDINLHQIIESICLSLNKRSDFLKGVMFSLKLLSPNNKPLDFSTEPPSRTTRQKILEAALQVFSSRNYHDATVEEIARIAEVGKGTVYRYFRSKEDLYRQMIDEKLDQLNSEIQKIIASQQDVMDIIWQCVTSYMQFFEQNKGLYRLILRDDAHSGGSKYLRRALKNLNPLKRKLLEAAKNGRFKPLNFETAFYGFMGFIHGVVQKWLDHNCNYSLLSEVPVVSEILLHGVIPKEEKQKPLFRKEEFDGQGSN